MSQPATSDSIIMRHQLPKYAAALSSFKNSTATLRILHSLPAAESAASIQQSPLPPPRTLYVLDSSFNPPTLAHLRIATSALLGDAEPSPSPKRLLLLLATQNADKTPKPASFEERLVMMQIFASDLVSSLPPTKQGISNTEDPSSEETTTNGNISQDEKFGVDIGVTKLPYFMDKASAISASGSYPPETSQVHLTGFDTLIRILDPKYYSPSYTLSPLEPFLLKHRLRVTYRTDDQWGGMAAQDEYLAELGEGRREHEGGKTDWVKEGRIVMVEGRVEGQEAVSSTKVRKAAKEGDKEMLKKLVTEGVAEWILEQGLYKED